MSNMYESGSLQGFKPHQQGPKGLPPSAFGQVITPAAETIYKRPSYIIINNAGTYAFNYNFTGSIGAGVAVAGFGTQYITGSVMAANQGNLKLDIQPTAWREIGATVGAVGDITYVYQGGL